MLTSTSFSSGFASMHASITPNFPFGSSHEIAGDSVRITWWPTTFFTITVGDVVGWCWNCPVWPAHHLRCILWIPLKYSVNVLKSWTSTGSSATNRRFFPDIHVDILQFSFIKLGHIQQSPWKLSVNFLQSWTSTGLFGGNCRFSPIIECEWSSLLMRITDSEIWEMVRMHAHVHKRHYGPISHFSNSDEHILHRLWQGLGDF